MNKRTAVTTDRIMTRRTALGLASSLAGLFWSARACAAAGHFWDSKPASQWTPEEIAELTQKSPWAKQVTAQYRTAMEDLKTQSDRQPAQGRGEAKIGECGLVPCGDIMPGTVTVIWESAQPMREALHPVIPPEFNGRYVISVRGLEGEQFPDRLKAGADLSAKGKPPIQPGLVRQRNSSWLFGFSRDLMSLDTGDKDVQFNVRTGVNFTATLLRATFNPKEMIYRGVLAL
jgi:hypothetical protein